MTADIWTHTAATRARYQANAAWQLAQEQAAQSAQGHDCLTCPRAEECLARYWAECPYAEPTPPAMTPTTLEASGTYSTSKRRKAMLTENQKQQIAALAAERDAAYAAEKARLTAETAMIATFRAWLASESEADCGHFWDAYDAFAALSRAAVTPAGQALVTYARCEYTTDFGDACGDEWEQAAQSAQGHDCLTCPHTEDCLARYWAECVFAEPTPPAMTPATLEASGTYSPREEF